MMEEGDEGKLFIGGLSWDTSEASLREHFKQYGEVKEAVVKIDKERNNRPRGFGFVTFVDPASADKVLAEPNHIIDGKKVDPKSAHAKSATPVQENKVFLGGIPPLGVEHTDRRAFEDAMNKLKAEVLRVLQESTSHTNSGIVQSVDIKVDNNNRDNRDTFKHKGFGFATLSTLQLTNEVCALNYIEVRGKSVEIKKAQPRDGKYSGGGGRGGGYAQLYQPPQAPQHYYGAYSHQDSSQAAHPQNHSYSYYSGYPQAAASSHSGYDGRHSGASSGSHGLGYEQYGGAYGDGSRGDASGGGGGGYNYPSYNYGSSGGGQGMHGYPQGSYAPQPAGQQQSNYYSMGVHHHST